jgi:competence protein ComEC
VQPLLTT